MGNESIVITPITLGYVDEFVGWNRAVINANNDAIYSAYKALLNECGKAEKRGVSEDEPLCDEGQKLFILLNNLVLNTRRRRAG